MTLKELEEYSVIANQIQSFRHEYIPSFIKGVDTTKSCLLYTSDAADD